MEESSSIPSTKSSAGIFIGVLLVFFSLFVAYLTKTFSSRRTKPQPPEASGAWPIIGHLHRLSGSEPTHKTLTKMANLHGPIFTLKLGMNRAVVVSNWEIAKECFTTNDKAFASRPKLLAAKHMGYNNTMFAFTQYGPLWHHIRKLTIVEVLSNSRLELFEHVRRFEVRISITKLYELCGEGKKTKMEMKKWFGDVTLNMVSRMVVGKRFSDAFEGSGSNCEGYQKALRDFFELFGVFVVGDSFPFLSWFDFGGYEKAMKKTAKDLDEAFDKFLEEHKQRRLNCGEVEMMEKDLMDVMLGNIDNIQQLSGYDGDSIIKATCLTLVLGGADTTKVTMTWVLSLLLNNEHILKKAQLEIEEQVGKERLVEESDLKNLKYLQAIIKETMRLYPAAPLLAPHESMQDCPISGYHIPAKTRLIVNAKMFQRDPFVWDEPDEFRPERFLTTHKDFDFRGQNPQFIPFGNGRRICPGISFAAQVMQLTLANLIHGFDIGRPSEKLIDMEESSGLASIKATPLEVVLTPRLSSQVYKGQFQCCSGYLH